MSDEYTRANFGALQQGEQDFQQTYNATKQTLDELESDLRRSLSEWEGDAQVAFHQAKAKWDAAAAHMATVMHGLGGVIRTAHQNYSGAERSNSGMWDA